MYLPYDISKRILRFRGAYMIRDKKGEHEAITDQYKHTQIALSNLYHYMLHGCETLEALEMVYDPIRQILRGMEELELDEIDIPQCHCDFCWCFECDTDKWVCAENMLC